MDKNNLTLITLILSNLFCVAKSQVAFAEKASFSQNTTYEVCFTPGQNCTQLIVEQISKASKSVYVQAYGFTSAPIAKAVVDAKGRGLDVKVILDKSQIKNNHYSSAKYLMNQNVPVWIDYKVSIAHNKVILIDGESLITGSFNFTGSAEKRNAENLLIISDKSLVNTYSNNWIKRFNHSIPAEQYLKR